jgi:uncharacterized protein YcaQ
MTAAARAKVRQLTRTDARRLATLGQRLAGERPASVVDCVKALGKIQVDPTAVVDRAERLVLWSRLGSYDREELRGALEEDPRQLFEYNAFLIPVEDLPLHRPAMQRFPRPEYTRGRYIRQWMGDNAGFRAYVLDELRRRGPLLSRDFDDRAEVPWQTGGWNDGKNVGRMVELLWRAGDIAIRRREGSQRVWDLFEHVFPEVPDEELPDEVVAIEIMERQLRASGFVQPGWGSAIDYRLPARDIGEDSLRTDGIAVPVAIDGLPGDWLAHRDLLEALHADAWQPRTTLLSPFDPLIGDRERTEALFDFRFRLEIYVPAAKREYGYYVMPILDGDRLIGRIDPVFDRKKKVLTLNAVYAEPDLPMDPELPDRVTTTIRDLASWLGATRIALPSELPDQLAPLHLILA